MSIKTTVKGHCLCGSVSFSAALKSNHVDACHCSMCQRWGGGPFIGIEAEGSDVKIAGEDHLSVYASSEWAERAFCSQCGSHMFYRLKPTGQLHFPIGLLESQPDLQFTKQIFVEEKSSCYDFANDTRMMTGAEVMAEFGA